MKLSLKERLINYFKARPKETISSGEIQRLVAVKTTYTPSNVSRRLRELENEGILRVEQKAGHAWYSWKGEEFDLVEYFNSKE